MPTSVSESEVRPEGGPKKFALIGAPGVGKTRALATWPAPILLFDCDDGAGAVKAGIEAGGGVVVWPETPDDILRRMMELRRECRFKTVAIDSLTSYFTLSKKAQRGEPKPGVPAKSDWGLNWGELMGRYHDIVLVGCELVRRYGVNFVVTGHIAPDYVELTISGEERRKRMLGWSIEVPGKGGDDILVAFDEVYLVAWQGPQIVTHTSRAVLDGFAFAAKSRYGVPGPIPGYLTYDKVLAALNGAAKKAHP